MPKNETPAPAQLVKLATLAERYDLSVWTLRDMIADGRLKAYRVGPRSLRVDPADFMRCVTEANPAGRERHELATA